MICLYHTVLELTPVHNVVVIEDEVNTAMSGSEPLLHQPSTSECQPSSSVLLSQQIVPSGAPESQGGDAFNYSEAMSDTSEELCSLEKLIAVFKGHFQILQIYRATGDNFEASMDCMLAGPTFPGIISVLQKRFERQSLVKVNVDADGVWQDMIVHYKSPALDLKKPIQVRVKKQPAIDTGGVRRQVYDNVFNDFVSNTHIKLFDGPSNSCRPLCTAESRSCGLFKVLGSMVAHSIAQDGIGFPYLSPTCYWYMVGLSSFLLVIYPWKRYLKLYSLKMTQNFTLRIK